MSLRPSSCLIRQAPPLTSLPNLAGSRVCDAGHLPPPPCAVTPPCARRRSDAEWKVYDRLGQVHVHVTCACACTCTCRMGSLRPSGAGACPCYMHMRRHMHMPNGKFTPVGGMCMSMLNITCASTCTCICTCTCTCTCTRTCTCVRRLHSAQNPIRRTRMPQHAHVRVRRARSLLVAAEKVSQVMLLVKQGRRRSLQEAVQLLVKMEEDDIPQVR